LEFGKGTRTVASEEKKLKIVKNKNRAKDLSWCVFLVLPFPFRCKDCSLQEIGWRLSLAFLFFFVFFSPKGFLKFSFGFVISGIGFCLDLSFLFILGLLGVIVGDSRSQLMGMMMMSF
jgi:hypothetical protein